MFNHSRENQEALGVGSSNISVKAPSLATYTDYSEAVFRTRNFCIEYMMFNKGELHCDQFLHLPVKHPLLATYTKNGHSV